MRNFLYGQWVSNYGVIKEDMILPLEEYNNFREFFTRKVQPREISQNKDELVAPADSKILQISEINGDSNVLVKGINYSLGEFLTGIKDYKMEGDVLESMKKAQDKSKSKIYQAIFYLNPGDYHRYHSPCEMLVKRAWHIVGYLAPVKESYIGKTPRVYETNERIALVGEYDQGFISNVYVGATNVGSMTLTFDKNLETNRPLGLDFQKSNIREYNQKENQANKNQLDPIYNQKENGILVPKGAECGIFQLGSTVVLLFETQDNVEFLYKPGDKIRYGTPFVKFVKNDK
ncbi:hypothetical protein PPERSA_03316 [Pseudocohnilembus persalinus]|uniref:phosphatidylserine decarboxylase n=1 Tax=Pseudocohnilembus persalinus TaxID=266149 RepID=A0A0V0Q8J4_PSEPJ|nr:hypothetical protein PPERSA_03316 [Pseudocohnilembus persalinus]|eukprot:KRW98485.1 hypothetical protein PPERSA_03316 [Pseudocohnilembus persalinus]